MNGLNCPAYANKNADSIFPRTEGIINTRCRTRRSYPPFLLRSRIWREPSGSVTTSRLSDRRRDAAEDRLPRSRSSVSFGCGLSRTGKPVVNGHRSLFLNPPETPARGYGGCCLPVMRCDVRRVSFRLGRLMNSVFPRKIFFRPVFRDDCFVFRQAQRSG